MAMTFRKIIVTDSLRRRTKIIYGATNVHFDSPIAELVNTMQGSLAQILPEQSSNIAALIDAGIGVEIDNSRDDFRVSAKIDQKLVVFGLPTLERVWAYIWFYLDIIDLAHKYGKGVEIDLRTEPSVAVGRELVLWAHDCETKGRQTPWPTHLPRPDRPTAATQDRIELVNNYFFHVVSFMLLHEIAHIELGHVPNKFEDRSAAHELEFCADKWAARFMLENWQADPRGEKVFTGRLTGIALGLSILAGVELYHYAAVDDHPDVAERLLTVFREFNPESQIDVAQKNDFPIYVCTTVMQAHFMNANVRFDFRKPYSDCTEFLIAAHRALQERK